MNPLTLEQIAACEAERVKVLGTHSAKKPNIKWRTVADRLKLSKLSVLHHFSPEEEYKQYISTINRCAARKPKKPYVQKRKVVGDSDIELITALYRQGRSPSYIAGKLPQSIGRGVVKRIFAELEPKFRVEREIEVANRKQAAHARTKEYYGVKPMEALGLNNYSIGPRAPEYLIADRDRRMQAYYEQPECVRMMGDPGPGQSALDRRK